MKTDLAAKIYCFSQMNDKKEVKHDIIYCLLWSIHTCFFLNFFLNYFLKYFCNYLGSRIGCTVPCGCLWLGSRMGCVPIFAILAQTHIWINSWGKKPVWMDHYIDKLINIDNNPESHIFYCILMFLIKP